MPFNLTGIARIGAGRKLHPIVFTDQGVLFICSCPATRNGQAAHRITWSKKGPASERTCVR